MKLANYTLGAWRPHQGKGIEQRNAITGEIIANTERKDLIRI